MLRDIRRGEDTQIDAVAMVIAAVGPDILVLQRFDHDHDLVALTAFADMLRDKGINYPHLYSRLPNAGMATGLDMDGNGRLGEPRDAQGYGAYAGHGGMAVLSRYPVLRNEIRDFSSFLWRDLPDADLPVVAGNPFPSEAAQAAQRLSSVAHWEVPVMLPDGTVLRLLTWHGTAPVFDGDEDRNGRRNRDETGFWLALIDGKLDMPPPEPPFIVLGDANLDPVDGDGRLDAITALLSHPALQNPAPESDGAERASLSQGGVNARHRGDARQDTADWGDGENDPGNMRVDYVLPSRGLTVLDTGVFWPTEGPLAAMVEAASRHRLVWVDINR